MRLFNRKAVITVQTGAADAKGTAPALQVTCTRDGFDCQFDVHKDLTGKPNRASIQIYNLTQAHRDALDAHSAKGKRPARVRVEAGYEDGVARIFEGDLRILYHDREADASFVTKIESGDGDAIVQTSRISKSWGPGTPVSVVIKDLAGALGIGEGNVRASTAGALLEGWGPTFTGGTAVSGSIFKELTRICKSSGLEWSIQDGTLQFLVTDKALSALAIKVTSDTGMEGVKKIDHRGRLHVVTRLIPGIFPGRKIQLEDKSEWKVDKARYHGQTRGHAWSIHIEATNPQSLPANSGRSRR